MESSPLAQLANHNHEFLPVAFVYQTIWLNLIGAVAAAIDSQWVELVSG